MDIHLSALLFLLILSGISWRTNCEIDETEGRFEAELEVIDLELVDDCDTLATGRKAALTTDDYQGKISYEKTHGTLLKYHADILKEYEDIPYEYTRAWTVLRYSGDHLLPAEDYSKLIEFANRNEQVMVHAKLPCLNGTVGCTYNKEGYRRVLQSARDYRVLEESWLRWQALLATNKKDYPDILQLVKKAAPENEKEDAEQYWEMLVDLEGAYATAENLWTEIQPLYTKLHDFVKQRVFKFYNITTNQTDIPVYLLGSNFGHDWSYIADMILPHPQLHYDADSFLKRQDMRYIYDMIGVTMGELKLGKVQWKTIYNRNLCEPYVINYCDSQRSEIYSCDSPSWVTYLDAYEAAMKVKLASQDYKSYPRQKLRYSVLDEALVGLASTLAIDATTRDGIVRRYSDEEAASESLKMSKLLLTALRVLPKLPYYLAADKWRLDELKNETISADPNWWPYRRNLQNVMGVTNTEADFLGDSYITSNKPYISKFLGTLLQFQLMQYFREMMLDPNGNVAVEMGNDENFINMINTRSSQNWQESVNYYFGISEVSASALLEYFQPLEEYLFGAPLKQSKITTTTTVTTTTTTTTMKPRTKKGKTLIEQSQVHISDKDESKLANKMKNEPVQNEDPNHNPKMANSEKPPVQANAETTATYIGGACLAVVCIALVGTVLYKRFKKRRRPQNNRRFET